MQRAFSIIPRRVAVIMLACVAVGLSGCASIQRPSLAPEMIAEAKNAAFPGLRFSADDPPAFVGATIDIGRPEYTVLALSGGGADGAFGVGLLSGLTASGRRPEYDVVTGVSTGALIAPFAFLGASRDTQSRDLYTGPHLAKLLRQGSPVRLLRGPSIYKNKELKSEIAKNITDDLLAAIANEHLRGRRLFVATADLDAQQMVVWDMGAIAASAGQQSKDLFRQILLAATSIPLVFDPVAISPQSPAEGVFETHSDATTFAHLYAGSTLFPVEDCRNGQRLCKLYVVAHNKLVAEPRTLKWQTPAVGKRVLQTLLKASLSTRLLVTKQMADANHISFQLAYLDVPFPSASPTEFDATYMQRLYEIGFAQGQRDQSWNDTLPSSR
jgi:hypothetical protein